MESGDYTKTLQGMILEIMPFENIPICLLQSNRNNYDFDMNVITRASLNIVDFASRCKNTEIGDRLLKCTAILNSSQKCKFTVLHYASHLGSREIVEAVVKSGADINAQSARKDTALHFATIQGNNKIVDILLKNGAECNIQNEKGWSALILATGIEVSGCLNALLLAGSDVNLQDFEGKTALYYACLFKDAEKVKVLIEAGADVNVMSDVSALHVLLPSIKHSHRLSNGRLLVSMETCSIKGYQNINHISELLMHANINISLKDQHGNTALHKAALSPGNVKLIEKLIQAGIDVNEQNNKGESAFHYACMSNKERRIIRILKDADADIKMQSKSGDTALHYAACSGSDELVTELIECGIEINRQNHLGETALYQSLKMLNLEVFETLVTNRAIVSKRDYIGHDPLFFMNNEIAVLKVFKLQDYFNSYRDVDGNTIFHLFFTQCRNTSDDNIWSLIQRRKELFLNYLPVQNIFGQTPLHVAAASKSCSAISLIFSTFDAHLQDILLVRDENGNTFFHTYLHTHISSKIYGNEDFDISFLKYLLEKNEYQSCSVEKIKCLMESKNSVGNTPLQVAFRDTLECRNEIFDSVVLHGTTWHESYAKSIFHMFLNAGANMKSKNSLRDTVLHFLMISFPTYPELAETAIENGSQKNVQNQFGESELFSVPFHQIDRYEHYLKYLIKARFDINICNKVGQSAILLHLDLRNATLHEIMAAFNNKAIFHRYDAFGSNLLHYVAWKEKRNFFIRCNRVDDDCHKIVHELSVVKDKLGQLPCDVAFARGNTGILREICLCEKKEHKQELLFYPRRLYYRSLKEKDKEFRYYIQCLSKVCSEKNIRKTLINAPFLGRVRFDKDACEVKKAIVNFVKYLCRRVGEKDKLLENDACLFGSADENTKVGLPNEFNFKCVLNEMSVPLVIEECNDTYINAKRKVDIYEPSIKVKIKKGHRSDLYSRFFNTECLSPSLIINRFRDIVSEIIQEPGMYAHPNLFREKIVFRKLNSSPNFKLKLRWCSCKYKNMQVNITIALAIKIRHPLDVKFYASDLNATTRKKEFVTLMIKSGYSFENISWLVSASDEEEERLKCISSEAREAYVISKVLCGSRVCPFVKGTVLHEDDIYKDTKECDAVISSYMLKNCLFYVYDEIQTKTVHGYVCGIFQKLLKFASSDTFPCYMFPNVDLFACYGRMRECIVVEMYAKLILNLLGKNVDFGDRDEQFPALATLRLHEIADKTDETLLQFLKEFKPSPNVNVQDLIMRGLSDAFHLNL